MSSERPISEDPEQQLRLACAELRQRLISGDSCRSEDFLDSYPSLSSNPHYAFELIQTELSARRELGQPVDPGEWYARFPRWRDQLQSWFRDQGLLAESVVPDSPTVAQSMPTADRAPSRPPPPRKSFGRYEVIATLGKGAMGVVYKARDTVLGRVVALKTIRSGKLAQPEEVDRFFQEARATAQVQHPNIIPLYDFDQEDDQHYLTMALAAGGSLAKGRELLGADPRKIAAIMEKIARAVHHLHSKGILHRDLKPGNIMLDERGEPMVSDFGLAKFLDADAELTQDGVVVGTPAYMAPEMATAQPSEATVRSDVWSLGVILYELLTGHRPFAGTGAREVSRNILLMDPVRPARLCPKLDRALETIVLKCLAKEPARRYGSADELAEDLGRWQRGEAIVARPEGWVRRSWRFARRHALASVACLLVATAAVAVLIGRHLLDPDRPLYAIEATLARGEPVDLIGKSGPPAWQRFPIHEGVIEKNPAPGDVFDLGSAGFCLLEVVRDPQAEAYLFSAEVRHDTGQKGDVGIYFGFSSYATDNGTDSVWCMWTFNDQGLVDRLDANQPPTKSHVALRLQRWNKIDKGGRLPHAVSALIDPKKQWRKLAVEVRPGQVQCFWGNKRFPPISRKELVDLPKHLLPDGPGMKPLCPPRGGLGLYVENGSASFRNVRIEPLK